MTLLRSLCLCLPILAAAAAEAPPPVVVPSTPTGMVDVASGLGPAQMTLQLVAADPATSPPPLSLWADPRAAASRSVAAAQLSQLLHGGVAAQTAFAGGLHWLSLEVQGPSASDPDHTRARFGLLVSHELAQALADAVGKTLTPGQATTVQGYAGTATSQLFAGSKPTRLLIGDPQLLARRLPLDAVHETIPDPAAPNLTVHVDFAQTMSLVKKLENAGIYYNLDPLVPRWRQQAPILDGHLQRSAGAWAGTLHLTAGNLPLHAIDPAFAKLLVPGKQLQGIIGISPVAVLQLIANLLTTEDAAQLETRLGMPLNAVADCITGDALLEVQADSVIPVGALCLQLRPNGRNRILISHLAAIWNGTATPAPDPSISMWVLDTPVGPVVLASTKDRLVVGDDAPLMQQLLLGQPGGGGLALTPGLCASVHIDLPGLSKQWLPLLWPLVSGSHLDLGPSPMLPISYQLPILATALVQQQAVPAKLSTLLAVPAPSLHIQQGANQVQVAMSAELPGVLRSVISGAGAPLSDAELARAVDQSFAVYVDSHQVPVQVTAVVVSLADGFHILEEDRTVRRPGLSEAQLATHLGDYERLLGPAPGELRRLLATSAPRVDLSWLPEPAALGAYLQPYSASVSIDPAGQGARLDEAGEPLATLAASAACLYLGLFEQPRMLIYEERFNAPGPPAHGTVTPGGASGGKTEQF